MNPYYQDEWVTQYCNGALTVLRTLESDSIDLLCADPPYGIGFMGKDWDKALPDKKIWAECLRVLKPGAFAFVMSIPRSDCQARMVIALQDVGFRVDFTPIYWAYASGFPKAQNIGKAVDKRPRRLELAENIGKIIKEHRIKKRLNLRQLGEICNEPLWKIGGTVFFETESTHRLPTKEQWLKLKNALDISSRYDELFEEAEREIIGKGGRTAKESCFGIGIQKEWDITKPATPQAKALDGSYGGFQPKPAVEVIIVCMKPLSEKAFVDQALKNRKGITWLDDGRIPHNEECKMMKAQTDIEVMTGQGKYGQAGRHEDVLELKSSGRFPANLLVSDDVLNDGREQNSNSLRKEKGSKTAFWGNAHEAIGQGGYPDSGSFSRYFDLDKWAQKTLPFLIVPKASKSEKNRGCEDLPEMRPSNRSEQVLLRSNFVSIEQMMEVGNYIKQAMAKKGITTGELNKEFDYVAGCDWWLSKKPNNVRVINPADYQKLKGILELDNRFDNLLLSNLYTEPKSVVDIASKWAKNSHPTVKPLKLMSYLITLGSRPGDIILDPFGGSGTTALASKLLGRKCVICEIEEKYCEIAAKRLNQSVMELKV